MLMNDANRVNAAEYVEGLMKRARIAQHTAELFSQERVDELSTAIAWTAVKEENAHELARLALEETRMGDYESKYKKIQKKIRGVQRDIKSAKTVGIIEIDAEKGIYKIAKPVGVIGAVIPCTNPEVTPVIKAMNGIKGRNAVIFAPHPRSKKTTLYTVELLREALKRHNAPEDLLICAENPTIEISNEIMKQCDLIIATGGGNMVKAAYSSGTPAYGVGAGNAVVVVDETADIKDAAHKIMLSKTFDLAAGCSCENSLVIRDCIYNQMIDHLKKEGGYLANNDEKRLLQNIMWSDGHLNKDIVAQPAEKIAQMAGILINRDNKFIMVEEDGIGKEFPFSGEKLSVILTLYKYRNFEDAVRTVNAIQDYQGSGHSCGIHSFDDAHIMQLSLNTRTSRVMVRQPQNYGNSGDWCNGMPFTVTLGCGTWGGNIVSENVVLKHYINTTWLSFPIEPVIPDDKELFGDIMFKD
ncbi:MAG: aldehyde dehydrogenase family protein [Clostridiales bacterium]|nr:aldehyde dehydrogenase family protein [Clostridiales bacterium]